MQIVVTFTKVCGCVQIFVKIGQKQRAVRNMTAIAFVLEVSIIILATRGTSIPMVVIVVFVTMVTLITNVTIHFLATSVLVTMSRLPLLP
jgi:hypothetical protein